MMNPYRKSVIWIASIGIIVALVYYFPNLFVNGKTLYKLGLNCYNSGEHGDYEDWDKMRRAAFYFEKAVNKGYTQKDVYSYLTHCYHVLSDETNEEKVYTLAIIQYPTDAEFHFYRGDCRKKLKNYQGAFDDFDSIIKQNPSANTSMMLIMTEAP